MEFGPPKINEVFDMQGKKKNFHPQEKKHVAFRMLHSVHIFDLFFFAYYLEFFKAFLRLPNIYTIQCQALYWVQCYLKEITFKSI